MSCKMVLFVHKSDSEIGLTDVQQQVLKSSPMRCFVYSQQDLVLKSVYDWKGVYGVLYGLVYDYGCPVGPLNSVLFNFIFSSTIYI